MANVLRLPQQLSRAPGEGDLVGASSRSATGFATRFSRLQRLSRHQLAVPGAVGFLTDTATVSTSSADSNLSNNTSTASNKVNPGRSNLGVCKFDSIGSRVADDESGALGHLVVSPSDSGTAARVGSYLRRIARQAIRLEGSL